MPLADLHDLAADLLLKAQSALSITPSGSPGRSFVSHCEPAYECCSSNGLLATWVSNVRPQMTAVQHSGGALASGGMSCCRTTAATVHLLLLRCIPTVDAHGSPPSVSVETNTGLLSHMDALALWARLTKAARDESPAGLFPMSYNKAPGEMVCVANQGGCGGWRWSWDVELTVMDPNL